MDIGAIDTDPWLVACQNGYLDLRTFTLGPPDPRALVTRAVAAPYDPDATCPRWTQFLREIFDGDVALIDFMQRSLGYALTGDTTEQVFWILYGLGADGKSTLLRVIYTVLGRPGRRARLRGSPDDLRRRGRDTFVLFLP